MKNSPDLAGGDTQTVRDAFANLVVGFLRGVLRRRHALTFTLTARNTFLEYQNAALRGAPVDPSLNAFADITDDEAKAFEYFSSVSELVYMTALLDTFVSDVARFLFLLNPQALGNDATVPVSSILRAKTRMYVVADTIEKRVRDLAYGSFATRLKDLRRLFGLTPAIAPEVLSALQEFADIRNIIVHDQAMHALTLDEDGALVSTSRGQGPHVSPLSSKQLERASATYAAVVLALCQEVRRRVLKLDQDPSFEVLEDILRSEIRMTESPPGESSTPDSS